eukprot:4083704-Prymnesium_polylepis.1
MAARCCSRSVSERARLIVSDTASARGRGGRRERGFGGGEGEGQPLRVLQWERNCGDRGAPGGGAGGCGQSGGSYGGAGPWARASLAWRGALRACGAACVQWGA